MVTVTVLTVCMRVAGYLTGYRASYINRNAALRREPMAAILGDVIMDYTAILGLLIIVIHLWLQ